MTTNKIPEHLKQFVVEQNFNEYTAVDHAVWRFVMRINYNYLSKTAHESYISGLKKTGIGIEKIPDIDEMNAILDKIGWQAVCVDGFIPPEAFMEFQAYKILVIAADIRQSNHIAYTPAPDIIHEAAGHAPIIADPAYAEYLRLFGEIGSKAISSSQDYELYEAIRHLSILKEKPGTPDAEIDKAAAKIDEIQNNMGEPSEMAKLRNLHWWTVEYGLIGDIKNPKIYGAGLLSSVGESKSCMKDEVKKIPYTLEAANYGFDITTRQPQLFVTPDFDKLTEVLNQFAESMSIRKGGLESVKKAVDSKGVTTCVYSSGLQASGNFVSYIEHNGKPAYLQAKGPVILCQDYRVLDGHGIDYHAEGFGSPVGKLKNIDTPPEDISLKKLKEMGIKSGENIVLEFESGIKVNGDLMSVRKNYKGKTLLMRFENCTVTNGDDKLFEPEWGIYDMAVGAEVVSVFAGSANPEEHKITYKASLVKTEKNIYDKKTKRLHKLYQQIRNIRDTNTNLNELNNIYSTLINDFSNEWLPVLEIYEIVNSETNFSELADKCLNHLSKFTQKEDELSELIKSGISISKN